MRCSPYQEIIAEFLGENRVADVIRYTSASLYGRSGWLRMALAMPNFAGLREKARWADGWVKADLLTE